MFAYCGNNPVSRSDETGDFWNIIIGAIVGAVTNYVTQVVNNIQEGCSFTEALTKDIDVGSIATSALAGAATAAIGAGATAVAAKCSSKAVQIGVRVVGSGVANVAGDAIQGKVNSLSDAASSMWKGIKIGVASEFLSHSASVLRREQFDSLPKQSQKDILKGEVFRDGNYYEHWTWKSYRSTAKFQNYLRRDSNLINNVVTIGDAFFS